MSVLCRSLTDRAEIRFVLAGIVEPGVVHDVLIALHGSGSDRWQFATQEGLGPPAAADYPLGSDLKTPAAFENNLSQLASEAAARDDQVVFLTMGSYLPKGYTRRAFQDGGLDYGDGDAKYATELWGEPQQVVAGIVEHNRRTRAVAGRHEHVRLVDLEAAIEASGQNFSDVCHLTRSGQQRLIAEVVPVVVEIVTGR